MIYKRVFIILIVFLYVSEFIAQTNAQKKDQNNYIISEVFSEDVFPLVYQNHASDIYLEDSESRVVKNAVNDLKKDFEKVSGVTPKIISKFRTGQKNVVIIGTIGKCKMLDKLLEQNKINIGDITNQWETFKISVVNNPLPSIDKALVIAGSDRRGTAFGIYELSNQIGVSPWYYWADVPVKQKSEIFIKNNSYKFGPPSVKYRGIFINDEKFALKKWAVKTQDQETNGIGLNTYRKIFELMLRLKANYFWNSENLERARIADEYAIILGTPHNRQMLASGWDEQKQGPWQYNINRDNIYNFWNDWVSKLGEFEGVYTMGMRGIKDLPMKGQLTIDEKVDLMEEIIDDQQEILTNNINQPIDNIPQILVLYKEVLELYKQGVSVPENITLIWPDDNFGYIKRLSNSKERTRKGGAGVYYHLSYLGRPHDYLWLSTANPVHVWSEMKKAYDFNARELWVFNVGDIKPAENNTSFALDMAWDVSAFNKDNIREHLKNWMANIFGNVLANELTDIIYEYYLLSFQRKPEYMGWDRLEPTTPVVDTEFSNIHYREAERRLKNSRRIKKKVDDIYRSLPQKQKAAFYELVWYPVSCLYYTDAKMLYAQTNRLYAKQGRASTNYYAGLAASYWDSIKIATKYYHNMLDGKWIDIIQWDGIGINPPKYWLSKTDADTILIENQPNYFMPPVEKNDPSNEASMGIFVEGFENKVLIDGQLNLPWFNSIYREQYFFEIFNKGEESFNYTISTSNDWIKVSSLKGNCKDKSRIVVNVDYEKLSSLKQETHQGYIIIKGTGITQKIDVFVFTPMDVELKELSGLFVENNGYISINAENFHRKKDMKNSGWEITKDLGVTGSSIGAYPFTAIPVEQEWELEHDKNGAYVEYDFYCFNTGWIDIYSYSLPTFPLNSQRRSLYAISIDDDPPFTINFETKIRSEKWKQNVQRNQSENKTKHFIKESGKHTLKIWMIDSGVFIDKIIMDFGGLKKSYLGPLQTQVNIVR